MNKLLTLCEQLHFIFLDSIKINLKEKLGQNGWRMGANNNDCSVPQKGLNKSNSSCALHNMSMSPRLS